ncbi:MAG: DUF3450 domain-containing protein [Gemmatimonadota bacterium]
MKETRCLLRLLTAVGTGWLLSGAAALAQEGAAAPAQEEVEPAEPSAPPPRDVLDEAVTLRSEANTELGETQRRVDKFSDETDKLLTRYQATLRQIESLHTYNRQMKELIASQETERASLQEQLGRIELVTRDVTPLMKRMIDALEAFVELDVPFLEEERKERIANLRKMMRRANVTESEKYRRIMEAYQIENEYGRTIEAYRSTLSQGEREMTVDFLRVGRIALLYQTLDEAEAAVWDQEKRAWEPLDRSYRSDIRQGLRIARKQAAPDLLRLPLPEPKTADGEI